MAFGLSSKFNSVSSPRSKPQLTDKVKQDEEDWYIPYNGPYEPPRPSARQEKNRDSWGDPIDGTEQVEEEEEHILGDPELHIRYGGVDTGNSGEWKSGGSGNGGDTKPRQRNRTQSGGSLFSGRTVSSGTVDPGRMSMGAYPRRSTVSSSSPRPPIPSYVNIDVTGGVGETPIPVYRASSSRDTSSTPTRKSLTSLFTFNSTSRRRTSSKPSPDTNRPPIPSSSVAQDQDTGKRPSSIDRTQTDPILVEEALRVSGGSNDGEYYNAFYSGLINLNADNKQPTYDSEAPNHTDFYFGHPTPFGKEPHSASSDPMSSSAPHPYAYSFEANSPQSAPPTQKSHLNTSTRNHDTQHTSFAQLQSATADSRHLLIPLRERALKNSASTPNLRGTQQPSPSPPRWNFKDRLLAAETWCDALLFPRPRLKVKQEGGGTPPYSSSGRIVSPPGSPVLDQPQALGAQLSVASRVLAHSRSLVNLSTPGVAGPSTWRREEERAMVLPEPKPVEELATLQSQNANLTPPKPSRPKSWALDDLVLPSPVPSLARVLEEGQILEHQRKKWQTQAINSFQNERARSLSRSRTKSLKAKKGGKRPDKTHPHIEFLAARGLLGNQDPIPIHIHPSREAGGRPRANSQTDNRGVAFGWPSGHGHSPSKATSKSSKSHSGTHSRSDSLGKSALKVAKSTAALCVGGIVITPVEEKDNDKLAIYGGDHVMRLPTPPHVGRISPFDVRISPTSTGVSDPNVGIAISTTPITDEAFDRESIRLPSHPYAQGGFYVSHQDDEVARTDTAPAQPSRSPPSSQVQQNATSAHPYALASSVEDYDSRIVPQARPDSLVPAPEKMWANWGTGGPHEVLPSDLQYSPFITSDGDNEKLPIRRSMRNSSPIYDTAGIGEALAWAVHRQSRDSGLGTSEGPESIAVGGQGSVSEEYSPVGIAIPSGSANRYSTARRIPVQYDASRPAHLHHAHKNSTSTPPPTSPVQMSSVEEQSEPETSIYERLGVPARNNSDGSSPGQSSSNSSPPVSPPPLGNVDDLESYRDLFYRPRGMSTNSITPPLNPRSPTHQPNIPWDVRSQGTNNTGLTSIVRQLSEELEETRGARISRSLSFSSRSSLSILRQSAYGSGRSPLADSGLRFVFANIQETASVEAAPNVKPIENEHENDDAQDAISAFHPSGQIPEDVETSTRASSPTCSAVDNDDLDAYRLGNVESVSTPPAETGEPRLSYIGQMSFAHGAGLEEDEGGDVLGTSPNFTRQTTAHNSLQPPSADPTRSSYMTSNSEGSRMSGLSDFPTPPPQQLTPAHMSLLSSYFDETLTPSELAEVQAQGIHRKPGTRSRAGSVTATLATMRNTGQDTPADNQDSLHDQASYFGNTKEIDDLIRVLPSTGR
ncbi:hypothetical protein Moror_13818 [Moniliophthora roreri MCA 2997]|uniref:Uncharacterized protein n=1 Tax=Moniliophthora roreri (strain MCA 2997) TaxID=1381753 RepID=V2XQD9_MONRO|nr:hypothetical protein Moror_13818 [Moniliophthora roreri MCA 2997]